MSQEGWVVAAGTKVNFPSPNATIEVVYPEIDIEKLLDLKEHCRKQNETTSIYEGGLVYQEVYELLTEIIKEKK